MSQDGQSVNEEWLRFGVFRSLNPFIARPVCLKRAESKHRLRAYVVKNPKKTRMVREQEILLCILLATGARGSALTLILLSCAS